MPYQCYMLRLSLSSSIEHENDWRIGKYCTRKKTAAGFVEAPCIWTLSMLRTTYLIQQPFVTWGPRTVKRSIDRFKGARELGWLGGGIATYL